MAMKYCEKVNFDANCTVRSTYVGWFCMSSEDLNIIGVAMYVYLIERTERASM